MPSPQLDAIIREVSALVDQNKELGAQVEHLKRELIASRRHAFTLRQELNKAKKAATPEQPEKSQSKEEGDGPEGLNVVLLIRKNVQAFSSQLPQQESSKILSRFLPFIVELSANGIAINPSLVRNNSGQ